MGDSVLTRNFSLGPKWIPGIIESVTGPVSYKVMLGDGRVVRRHVDQIHVQHPTPDKSTERQQTDPTQLSQAETILDVEEVVLSEEMEESTATEVAGQPVAAGQSETEKGTVTVSNATPVRRQSKRETKLPSHLKDFKLK